MLYAADIDYIAPEKYANKLGLNVRKGMYDKKTRVQSGLNLRINPTSFLK